MGVVRLVAPFVVICFATGAMFAQTPALDSASGRKVDLTVAQKQILYQSISNTQKNNAAPTGFRATVGAQVPGGVALVPVPAAIADIMPQTKGLETAMVEGQVLLVEPRRQDGRGGDCSGTLAKKTVTGPHPQNGIWFCRHNSAGHRTGCRHIRCDNCSGPAGLYFHGSIP